MRTLGVTEQTYYRWRAKGLKVPARQPRRGRLWLIDGSCLRLRPERANHVWAYDFVEDRTRDGRKADVIDVLADLFILRGIPGHIRSDQGPEFVATAVRAWISGVAAQTAFIEPGSPWENGCVERHYNTQRPHSSLGYPPPAPEALLSMPWNPSGSGSSSGGTTTAH